MKTHVSFLGALCFLSLNALAQEPAIEVAKAIPTTDSKPPTVEPTTESEDDSPVPLPALAHFERLWKDSMFTTKALPAPDVPAGPNFTDNFSLSGTFEERGKMMAVLIDKTTSGIVQAYIGQDNDLGFRISKIEPDEVSGQMRIQLQKGNQTGWVKIDDGSGSPPPAQLQPGTAPGGPLATRPGAPTTAARPAHQPQAPQNIPRAEPVSSIPPLPQAPAANMRAGMPAAQPSLPGDPPLPPP